MLIWLSAKGLTAGEVQARLAEVYGAEVSRQPFSGLDPGSWTHETLDPELR